MDLRAGVKRWGRRVAAAGVLMVVASCGGGGGGSSNPGGGGGGNEPGSMVPPAPALGDTLYTDAAVLRPLVDGSTLSHDGETRAAPADGFQAESLTFAMAASGSEFVETLTSQSEGSFDRRVRFVSGRVENVEPVDLSGLGEEDVVTIELRSPVRVGDQFVSLEKRYTDTALDVDGDRVADQLDVALYGRVIGAEDYTPPGRPTLKTVRVDTVFKLRTRASSTGEWSEPLQATQRKWYAEGLGLVRMEDVLPDDEGEAFVATRFGIDYWNGVDRGWGPLPARTLKWADDSQFAGAAYSPKAMARMGNELIITSMRSNGTLAYHKVGPTGQAISSTAQTYAVNDVGDTILATDRRWIYIDREFAGSETRFVMTVTDPTGAIVGDTRILLDMSSTANTDLYAESPVAFAAGPEHVWAVWGRDRRETDEFGEFDNCDLMIRAWDLRGRPVRPETRLATIERQSCSIGSKPFNLVGLSANATQAIVSWIRNDSPSADSVLWYGTVDLTGPREFTAAFGTAAIRGGRGWGLVPLALEADGGVLAWNLAFNPREPGMGAVRMVADGTLSSPSAAPATDDRLSITAALNTDYFHAALKGQRFVVASTVASAFPGQTTVQERILVADEPVPADPARAWTTKTAWLTYPGGLLDSVVRTPSIAIFDDYMVSQVLKDQDATFTQVQFLWTR